MLNEAKKTSSFLYLFFRINFQFLPCGKEQKFKSSQCENNFFFLVPFKEAKEKAKLLAIGALNGRRWKRRNGENEKQYQKAPQQ